ncbi:MAG: glycosyltransferase family 39 protein [Kouleothrix sp.]|nr:glycosyltransferase family 39 protein [Kouleothrix sp.]
MAGPALAPVAEPTAAPIAWRALLGERLAWLRAHREETLAVLAAGGAALYTILFFPHPAQLTHPGEFGHPFQGLHWVRDFLLERQSLLAPTLVLFVTVVVLGLLGLAIARRDTPARAMYAVQAALLITALGLAGLGQLALLGFYAGAAPIYYLSAAVLFAIWSASYRPQLTADLFEAAWPRWLEITLLALTLGLTIFARFYGLRFYQYGIEGDESKWTVEVVNAMVDGVFPGGTEFHLSTMPLSFFMQAPFHWLLGPSILAGRISVAFYSVLGSIVFYWLARSLTSAPVAWLATTLLAVSLLDVSASRLANVESHTKLAPLLALLLLARAVRTGKPASYFLAGLGVAAAMLTYDTALPLAAVCSLIVLYELIRTRAGFAEWVRRISAFSAPILIIMPMTIAYLSGRLQYYVQYASGSPESQYGRAGRLALNLGEVLKALFVQTAGDFLYNRNGPLFDSALLPWMVLGTVLALVQWRRGRMLWILLWGSLFFFFAPVLTHSPFGRVFYPGLPAMYLLIALGLYGAYRSLGRALGPALQPGLKMLALVGLTLLVVSNIYLYFNLVLDFGDRQMRRELYDVSQAAAGPGAMVYYPYLQNGGDPVEFEQPFMIWLGTRVPGTRTAERYPHAVVPLEALLPDLTSLQGAYERVEVVWLTFVNPDTQPTRDQVLQQLRGCYPSATQVQGRFYDRYVIPGADLRASACAQ